MLGTERGQVLEAEVMSDADELVEHGWLKRRTLDNGDQCYSWTTTAETAIELDALRQDAEARQN